MGLKEVQEYATKLKKAEKMKELKEQVRLGGSSGELERSSSQMNTMTYVEIVSFRTLHA